MNENSPLLHSEGQEAKAKEDRGHFKHSSDGSRQENAEPIVQNDAESAKAQIDDVPREEIDKETRRCVMCAMPALAIGVFLAAADQTIVVSIYGEISSEMNSLSNTSWIATG